VAQKRKRKLTLCQFSWPRGGNRPNLATCRHSIAIKGARGDRGDLRQSRKNTRLPQKAWEHLRRLGFVDGEHGKKYSPQKNSSSKNSREMAPVVCLFGGAPKFSTKFSKFVRI
jgi:hypothetical protein